MKTFKFASLIILALWIIIVAVIEVEAYPSTQDRCLAGFANLSITRVDPDGSIFYEDSNHNVIIYHTEGWIETKNGIHVCPGNPPYMPGAKEVVLVLTSDCSNVEIDNLDGGWSLVADEKGYIVLHYGQSLFVPAEGIIDAHRYRAIEVPCY